jgi:hypothetical protein
MEKAPYSYDTMVSHAITVFSDKVSAECARLIRDFKQHEGLEHLEYWQPQHPLTLTASVVAMCEKEARGLIAELDNLVAAGGDDVPASGAGHLTETFSGGLLYLGSLPRYALEAVLGNDQAEIERLSVEAEKQWQPHRTKLDYEFGKMVRRHRLRSMATDSAYERILTSIRGMGNAMERAPEAYEHLEEERLRDIILTGLNGTFPGGATGETFNRVGKTDIAVRVDSAVVFIAECKFWAGEQVLLETIDQLLRYLTWHDGKAGIVVFVKNVGFTAVLKQVPEIVAKHANFAGHLPYAQAAGFRFKLKNLSDTDCEHTVTLLAFHLPKVS